jgi:hypothetical protein
MRRFLVLTLVLMAAGGTACSDSSGPNRSLTYGTFAIDLPLFNIQTVGPCQVRAFAITVDSDATGATQVSIPDSMGYACATIVLEPSLQLTDFNKVGDSLEMVWTDDSVLVPATLTLRWKPGKTNLSGTARLSPTGANTSDLQLWTGVRQ